MGKSWCIVEFPDGVQIVPQCCIQGDQCFWQYLKALIPKKYLKKYVREYKEPDENWTLHTVRILGVYDCYELALPKLKLAETQSDLNTDEETYKNSRSSRKRIIYTSEEEDQSDDEITGIKSYPRFPKNVLPTNKPIKKIGESRRDCSIPKIRKVALTQTPKSWSSNFSITENVQPVSSMNKTVTDCCTCCCKFDKEYKRRLENEINDTKNQLRLILQILREQGSPQATHNNNIHENPINEDFEGLPIKTVADLDNWESNLLKNEQKKMIEFLSRIGGNEINTIVKNIVKKSFCGLRCM